MYNGYGASPKNVSFTIESCILMYSKGKKIPEKMSFNLKR